MKGSIRDVVVFAFGGLSVISLVGLRAAQEGGRLRLHPGGGGRGEQTAATSAGSKERSRGAVLLISVPVPIIRGCCPNFTRRIGVFL